LKNVIVLNDSINQNLTAYFADVTITGKVSFQGAEPNNIPTKNPNTALIILTKPLYMV
jgi:hypothetical protein